MFPKGQQMQKLLFSTPDKLSGVQETFWLYPIHSLSVCFFVHAVNGYRPKHCPKSRNRVLSYTMCWYTQSNSMSFIGKENASLNLIWMLKSDKFINTFCPVSYFYLFITIFTIRECTGLPSCLVDGFPFRQLTWLVSPGSSYLSSLSHLKELLCLTAPRASKAGHSPHNLHQPTSFSMTTEPLGFTHSTTAPDEGSQTAWFVKPNGTNWMQHSLVSIYTKLCDCKHFFSPIFLVGFCCLSWLLVTVDSMLLLSCSSL